MSVEPLNSETLFAVEGLSKHFGGAAKGLFQKAKPVVKAVNDVSFTITKGETFGLVGESGSGKSTVARLMLRAYDVTAGSIRFRRGDGNTVELASAGKAELQALRRQMQMIFQDPYSSLNPRMTLLELVGEPLLVHGVASGSELEDRVAELLKLVGLRPEFRGRYPHAFSGGQRQRIGIARALALNPAFIAADEAVSALDVSVAAQNINLMQDLQEQFGLTYLFITHDLSMVQHISNRIGVMYVGRLMEVSATEPMFERPLHPYTEALLSAVPQPDPKRNRGRKRIMLKGEIPDASNPPTGCAFHPRCPYAKDICKVEEPELREALPGRFSRCHFAGELSLAGAY